MATDAASPTKYQAKMVVSKLLEDFYVAFDGEILYQLENIS